MEVDCKCCLCGKVGAGSLEGRFPSNPRGTGLKMRLEHSFVTRKRHIYDGRSGESSGYVTLREMWVMCARRRIVGSFASDRIWGIAA